MVKGNGVGKSEKGERSVTGKRSDRNRHPGVRTTCMAQLHAAIKSRRRFNPLKAADAAPALPCATCSRSHFLVSHCSILNTDLATLTTVNPSALITYHHVHHVPNTLQVQPPAPGHVTTKSCPLLPPAHILSMPSTPHHHPRVPDTLTQQLAKISHTNLVALDLFLTVTITHCN